MLKRGLAIAVGLAGMGAVALPAMAEKVGEATRVRLVAYQTPPSAARETVYRLSAILRNAKLETVADAAMEVTFADNSTLTLGPSSEAVVDEFVYAGPGSVAGQTLKYTKGVFRFVSGSVPKDKVKLQTPTVTIGVRGTIVRARIAPTGATTVFFEEGSGNVCGAGGACVDMKPGDMVQADSKGNLGAPEQKAWSTGDDSTDFGMGPFDRRFRGPDAGGGGNDGTGPSGGGNSPGN
jgi:ferric-dicitrate binding protein FerR (iron transport regulator)